MKIILLYTIILSFACSISAQQSIIQPSPQSITHGAGNVEFDTNLASFIDELQRTDAVSLASKSGIYKFSRIDGKKKTKYKLYIGKRGDKSLASVGYSIPLNTEGYYIHADDKQMVIAAHNSRGLFYAMQTLGQLREGNSFPRITITDYPDIAFRGVVEGFYGEPWSHEARLRQIKFYGENKLNTYIYGPKDDPYHSTPNWRIPYPQKEAEQIKELIDAAHRSSVDFVWAIHPGQDIKWNDEDRANLIAKFENMYNLGVRSFAVFFDDISGEGTKAEGQAALLNYIDDNFVQKKGDVTPLIMCPTEYNKSWSNVEGGYLTTLGDKLNPSIQIMWTGNRVIACIDMQSMLWINKLIKRNAYIWWNFPVSDYVRDHLLLGPVYGNTLDIKDKMSGFVSNPMERAEASKIALYSVADYAWNLAKYDSVKSWNRAIEHLFPNDNAAMKIFADHNSDLGANGHGFRREESLKLKPILLELQTDDAHTKKNVIKTLHDEISQFSEISQTLLNSTDNPELIAEIKPWLQQFALLGKYGVSVVEMTQQLSDKSEFTKHYNNARHLQKAMYDLDVSENQNPYQPGVKTGSLYLLPSLNNLFETSTLAHNSVFGDTLNAKANYSPFSYVSNVTQLALLPLQTKGKQVRLAPVNEVVNWVKDGYVMVEFEKECSIARVNIDLGTKNIVSAFKFQYLNGNRWVNATMSQNGDETKIKVELPKDNMVKAFRLINSSNNQQQLFLKRFEINVK